MLYIISSEFFIFRYFPSEVSCVLELYPMICIQTGLGVGVGVGVSLGVGVGVGVGLTSIN